MVASVNWIARYLLCIHFCKRYLAKKRYAFLLAILTLLVMGVLSFGMYPVKILCICLCWAFFTFSFTYGNALAEQYRYTNFRINLVIEDMNDMEIFTSEDIKTVQISGNIGKSPVIRQQNQSYQILNRLVPNTFGSGWVWSEYYFYEYFSFINVTKDSTIDLTAYNLLIIKDTMYHTIRGNEKYVLIELK